MLTWDVCTRGDIWCKSNWPQVYVTKVVTHVATRCLCLGRVRLTFCLIGSQPASQLASCNWPANQPCDKISTCQVLIWSAIWWQEDWEPNHIGPQSRVPALPLVPLGECPTSPRPGKDPCLGSHHSCWFPLGSDLPDQGQASDTNELCSLLYTFGTMFRDCFQFCICAA